MRYERKRHTVDGERFAVSAPSKFSRKYFPVALAISILITFSTIKGRRLYSRKSFRGTPENRGKREKFSLFLVAMYVAVST